jgi:hypothetical protein
MPMGGEPFVRRPEQAATGSHSDRNPHKVS